MYITKSLLPVTFTSYKPNKNMFKKTEIKRTRICIWEKIDLRMNYPTKLNYK